MHGMPNPPVHPILNWTNVELDNLYFRPFFRKPNPTSLNWMAWRGTTLNCPIQRGIVWHCSKWFSPSLNYLSDGKKLEKALKQKWRKSLLKQKWGNSLQIYPPSREKQQENEGKYCIQGWKLLPPSLLAPFLQRRSPPEGFHSGPSSLTRIYHIPHAKTRISLHVR